MINYLIIGNGVAGTTAAGEIRHLDKEVKEHLETNQANIFAAGDVAD
jgi:thioredoxin reductase